MKPWDSEDPRYWLKMSRVGMACCLYVGITLAAIDLGILEYMLWLLIAGYACLCFHMEWSITRYLDRHSDS